MLYVLICTLDDKVVNVIVVLDKTVKVHGLNSLSKDALRGEETPCMTDKEIR
jgi:hypothetical protein